MDILESFLRMLLALLIGAAIGYEREVSGHTAGFRTHAVVCIGAALVSLTGYMIFSRGFSDDMSRYGAQVISGIGFLGAGAILKSNDKVKGLTTAASLWTTACLGLALGTGAYAIASGAAVLLIATLRFLKWFEDRRIVQKNRFIVTVTFEQESIDTLDQVFEKLSSMRIDVREWPMISKKEITFFGTTSSKVPPEMILRELLRLENINALQTHRIS